MPIIISFMGWSGTGKTTLILKLLKEMTHRGYRLSALKNTHHALELDKEGSDSRRFHRAGAEGVGLSHDGGITLFLPPQEWTAELLNRCFPEADFILGEGLKTPGVFRIETAGDIQASEKLKGSPEVWNIVLTDSPALAEELRPTGITILPQKDIRPLCHLLESLATGS